METTTKAAAHRDTRQRNGQGRLLDRQLESSLSLFAELPAEGRKEEKWQAVQAQIDQRPLRLLLRADSKEDRELQRLPAEAVTEGAGQPGHQGKNGKCRLCNSINRD